MDKTIICFHNPDEENGYLSNWWLSDFEVDGIKFTSAEQYMMYGVFGKLKIQVLAMKNAIISTT